jgi:hypothetical protein
MVCISRPPVELNDDIDGLGRYHFATFPTVAAEIELKVT